ncbi:hypothetical protein [Thiorhodococcus mannitoliphagus]|nr:hypothetical protein [Thiorhodococcus mannitoliphagus]
MHPVFRIAIVVLAFFALRQFIIFLSPFITIVLMIWIVLKVI